MKSKNIAVLLLTSGNAITIKKFNNLAEVEQMADPNFDLMKILKDAEQATNELSDLVVKTNLNGSQPQETKIQAPTINKPQKD